MPIGANIRPIATNREATRTELGLAETDFAVGYFGLLNRSKGFDTLLESFAKLAGDSWKLVIVGGETGETDATNLVYVQELALLINKLKLENRIIRTGHRSATETSQLLTSLDAMALPFRDGASFRRGSLLAALAHGLPIITTRVANSADSASGSQLKAEQNVLLIPANDPAALAEALTRLQQDETLRQTLSAGALELSQAFGWPEIVQELLDVYQTVLKQPT